LKTAGRSRPQPRSSRTVTPTAKLASQLASDLKATEIVVLDLAAMPDSTALTDSFVICTGRSDIHVSAICERIADGMKKRGHSLLSSEGVDRGQWALLDYGDIVVHVFQENVRKHYDLERLWAAAPRWTYSEGSAIENSAGLTRDAP
jgi:ribosome-associated protein